MNCVITSYSKQSKDQKAKSSITLSVLKKILSYQSKNRDFNFHLLTNLKILFFFTHTQNEAKVYTRIFVKKSVIKKFVLFFLIIKY